jgi:hypothetical protein
MTLIPTGILSTWRTRARRGALETLDNLLEFRALIPDFKAESVLMEAYREAAESMMMSGETLRDYIGKIREYPAEKLRFWINEGVSWDHFDKANLLAEFAHKPPAQLLDEAINPGNATGETMTVKELTAYALGEISSPMKAEVYYFSVELSRLRKFPNRFNWEPEKSSRYLSWLEAGKEFFE